MFLIKFCTLEILKFRHPKLPKFMFEKIVEIIQKLIQKIKISLKIIQIWSNLLKF